MGNYKSVPCTVVDVRVSRSRGKRGGVNKVYAPIYSFYYDGDDHRLCSSLATNLKQRSRVGRRTNIFIDERTGKIYNPDDEAKIFFIILGGIGIMFFGASLFNLGIL